MSVIGMRDLSRRTSEVVEEVQRTGEPAIVTRRGRPAAAVVPIDPEALEDFILAHSPRIRRALRRAERDLAAGRTRSWDEVKADLVRGDPDLAAALRGLAADERGTRDGGELRARPAASSIDRGRGSRNRRP